MQARAIALHYYLQEDVVAIARDLLGKVLVTNINNKYCAAIIAETEAYAGVTDRASHAYANKRTKRNETMYLQGGRSYVYLCYGLHHLFNIVTHVENVPHAVLIRNIIPLDGIDIMLQRRGKAKLDKSFSTGPGTMSMAMGINTEHNNVSLCGNLIWLEDRKLKFPENQILSGPRIGIDYAGQDAALPYRFWVNFK
jgi:DNA-3-methyladenine glycosylase